MTTRKLSQLLKHCFQKLFNEKPLALAPLEEVIPCKSTITKNVYAETVDKTTKHTQVVLVEVESFQNWSAVHLAKMSNYTRDGEDPNLQITHYPPSNRLH